MLIEEDTLDDALAAVYPQLLKAPQLGATRGNTQELLGVNILIRQPRARLSRSETRGKAFSSLGELLWYLSKENDLAFILPYIPAYKNESEDGVVVYGGYGPRLFSQRGNDQIANVIAALRDKPTTRRAVVQVFAAEDVAARHKEVPCTTTLQFLVRDDALQMITTMRSNDAYLGLPHDVFCFTMLQEIVARSLNLDVGVYRHFVGSLHVYAKHFSAIESYLSEAFQARVEMPPMPTGDPWSALKALGEAEGLIRRGEAVDAEALGLDPYWADLVRLLQVFHANDDATIQGLRNAMHFKRYFMYIDRRMKPNE